MGVETLSKPGAKPSAKIMLFRVPWRAYLFYAIIKATKVNKETGDDRQVIRLKNAR